MSRVLACLGFALVAAGCSATTGDDGMIILNNTAAPAGTCEFTGQTGQPFLAHGVVDTLSPVGYQMAPLIASKITATSDQTLQRTIQLRGAYVDLSVVGGTDVTLPDDAQHFQQLVSGSVLPGGTVNVGFGLIPVDALEAIAQASPTSDVEVQATVRVWGTLGGGEVDSAPFIFPVTVCTGCVVRSLGACPMAVPDTDVANSCNPYQDGVYDCCTEPDGSLTCPSRSM
jgi:hypothetical protein